MDVPELLHPQYPFGSASYHTCTAVQTWTGVAAEKLMKKISERRVVAEMARESYMIETIVHGYRVYKDVWCAAVGEELSCTREVRTVAICSL